MTLVLVRKRSRVQASSTAQNEKQVSPTYDACFFVIGEALTSDLYKPSFAKGGFGWNVNISPVGATAPTSSSLVNSSKEGRCKSFLFFFVSAPILNLIGK